MVLMCRLYYQLEESVIMKRYIIKQYSIVLIAILMLIVLITI